MKYRSFVIIGLVSFGLSRIANWITLRLGGDPMEGAGLLLFFLVASLFYVSVFSPTRVVFSGKKTEYVLTGQGELTGQVFLSSHYPGYREVSRSSQGRVFADSVGKILCTQYATSGERKEASLSLPHLFLSVCICAGIAMMAEGILPTLAAGGLDPLLDALWEGLERLWINLYYVLIQGYILPKLQQIPHLLTSVRFF